jgi:MSHA biogenesis protein MshQ
VPVNWQISFTGSTGGSTNIHEIGSLKVCAQTLIPPTGSSTAAGFNAIDSALPNTKQNALFGHIYTKVAGVPFKLNVAALAPPVGGVSQGVNTAYASSGNKTVTVKLFDDTQAGGSCIASASACSACSKTVVATQTMTFTSGNAGFKTSDDFSFTVPGVYKRLIAQISDGTTTGCSVDAFAVRPASYALTSNAAPKTKAGVAFTITATPQDSSGVQYASAATGSPTFDNTKAPAVSGTQTLLLQSWSPGATSGTFIYNDVGTFSLPANAIYDAQYANGSGEAQDRTNGDCNPGSGSPYVPATSNTVDAGGKFGCDIGSLASPSFGRFYPDHYEASLAATQACSADGFSYMGQPFSMTSASAGSMQIKALAAGQTFASAPGLPSYTAMYGFLADVWFAAQNGVASTDLIQCVSSSQNPTGSRCAATTLYHSGNKSKAWNAGSFTVAPTTYYFDPPRDATTTPDATWGPYDLLNIGVTVSDPDGSTLTIPAGQSFVLGGVTYQTVNGSLPMKMRYGRMRIQNASGSEQAPIMVPVWLEYWSGSAWMPNLLDASCTRLLGPPPTAYAGNDAARACYGGTSGSGAQCTSATAGGVGSIYTTRLSNVPANSGVPAYGAATFSYGQRNVMLAAPKAAGTLSVSVQAPAWLKIGPANTTGANPSATVRYSSYNSRFIFLRENY